MQSFEVVVPDLSSSSHPYTITGADCQVLSIELPSQSKAECEPGSMLIMSSDISTTVECGSCSRVCTGESLCKVIYTNQGQDTGFLALTPNFPSKVIPANLSNYGGKLIVKSGAYMAAIGDVKIAADVDCNCCSCCCGGLGFIRQAASGTGTVFLTAGGTVVQKVLAPGEQILVDTNSVVGFQESVEMGIKAAGGCCTCCCGGEGMFNTTLTGPGLVILQSMSFEKYKEAILPKVKLQKGDTALDA
eukprot:CAMPEP_0185025314 /NCGR_PEP_ID=MMETSP1103-20130426/8325_1 /TAXON_ID=36769 /ORGANISM="Paraphysomonas bandaiensis, Strain Caron Lab Isolate" /LENGTH=245 /DNA_ID=CAMNT_0027558493 /DNA_START=60 /DNA_END=797 /DNA_ORIENTATION=-